MSLYANELLFESIQIRDGIPQRLELHDERMNRSRKHFFPTAPALSLSNAIEVPHELSSGLVKCRVSYGESISKVDFSRYTPRVHPGVVLATVPDTFDYSYKYSIRDTFIDLEEKHAGKAVLLVRNGMITDGTYANLAFRRGDKWFTPKDYLLNGVMRRWLLAQNQIEEAEISASDLHLFDGVKLINAMLEWESSPVLPLHF